MATTRVVGFIAASALLAWPCSAQEPPVVSPPVVSPTTLPTPAAQEPSQGHDENSTQPGVVQDKRAFGVLPNYRTADGTVPYMPISWKLKFKIAEMDTFDWPSYILGGVFAGISQVTNSNPSFGQGLEGYAKRYAANTADQDLGNFMTEAIMPSLLHEDPRYFRKVNGSVRSRVFYAVTRVFVTKTDSGGSSFNFAEWLGNGSVAALGNLYYPDARGFNATMQRTVTQVGTDAISQVLKEFWPDIKRKWFSHHGDGNDGAGAIGN